MCLYLWFINRPSVAWAVLWTPSSFIQSRSWFVKISSTLCRSQTVRAGKLKFWEIVQPPMCHMSQVTCHMSHVSYQVSGVTCHESGVRCQVFFLLLFFCEWKKKETKIYSTQYKSRFICHVNLITTSFLALRNLWHSLHMFLDILNLRREREKNIFIMWSQVYGKSALIVWQITSANKISKIWTSRRYILVVTQFTT